jgi:BRCT domain type II-containing protein
MVGTAILSAGAGSFKEKLINALKNKQPIVYTEMTALGKDAAEELAKQFGSDIAHALQVNGAIGPYSVMRKFTDNLGGN